MTTVAEWALLAVASAVLGAEVLAWSGALQRWLLRRATLALPNRTQGRYREEWLAELEGVPDGPITRAVWVLSLYARRRSLAKALGRNVRGLVLKRTLDVIMSSVFLLGLTPVLFVIAIIVRITTRAPALARIQKVAPDGRQIVLLQFRTHHPKELKVTRIGRFLHATGIDHMPELLNVLKGDMSFVGPRPQNPVCEEQERVAELDVRPGLTGLWVLNGEPGEESHLETYARSRSAKSDLLVLARILLYRSKHPPRR